MLSIIQLDAIVRHTLLPARIHRSKRHGRKSQTLGVRHRTNSVAKGMRSGSIRQKNKTNQKRNVFHAKIHRSERHGIEVLTLGPTSE